MGRYRMSFVKPTAPYTQSWIGTVSIPASAAAGTVVGATINTDLSSGTQYTTVPLPSDQYLLVYDVFVTAAPSVDGFVQFKVNNISQGQSFGPLSQTQRTFGSGRLTMRNNPLVITPSGLLSVAYITAAANGTSAVTQTFNISVMFIPRGYKGPVVF